MKQGFRVRIGSLGVVACSWKFKGCSSALCGVMADLDHCNQLVFCSGGISVPMMADIVQGFTREFASP